MSRDLMFSRLCRLRRLAFASAGALCALHCTCRDISLLIAAEIDQACVTRFTNEAPSAYEAVRAAVGRIAVDGKYQFVQTWNSPERRATEETTLSFHIARQARTSAFKITISDDREKETPAQDFVTNDRYWFRLTRPNGPTTSYQLFNGAMLPNAVDQGDMHKHFLFRLTTFEWYVDVGMRIWYLPLLDVFTDSEFRLVEARRMASRESTAGHNMRFAFDYTGAARDGFRYPSGRYWAEVNPDNSWLVDRMGIDVPVEDSRNVVNVSYQKTYNNVPFPITLVLKNTPLADGKIDYDEATTVTFAAPQELDEPDASFYLPHYGIDESALVIAEPSWSKRWILLNLGICGVVCALWMIGRARRNRSRTSNLGHASGGPAQHVTG